MQLPKSYYLPAWRSRTIGVILIIVGLGVSLTSPLLSFESVGDFLFSLLMLLFKAGFLVGGYVFLKYASGVERARLDNKGFYYREIPKGSGMSKVAMDAGPLTFVPYSAINQFEIKSSFWMGKQLYLNSMPLTALGVLSDQEKTELCDHINSMRP